MYKQQPVLIPMCSSFELEYCSVDAERAENHPRRALVAEVLYDCTANIRCKSTIFVRDNTAEPHACNGVQMFLSGGKVLLYGTLPTCGAQLALGRLYNLQQTIERITKNATTVFIVGIPPARQLHSARGGLRSIMLALSTWVI